MPSLWTNFFNFHAVFSKIIVKQESIPVGCVLSAAVAVSPATHAPLPCICPTMHAPSHHVCPCHACPLPHMPPVMHAPLSHMSPPHNPPAMHTPQTEFLTHACESITFPQLLLRTVTIGFWPKLRGWHPSPLENPRFTTVVGTMVCREEVMVHVSCFICHVSCVIIHEMSCLEMSYNEMSSRCLETFYYLVPTGNSETT